MSRRYLTLCSTPTRDRLSRIITGRSACQEPLGQVRSDETGAAGDQDGPRMDCGWRRAEGGFGCGSLFHPANPTSEIRTDPAAPAWAQAQSHTGERPQGPANSRGETAVWAYHPTAGVPRTGATDGRGRRWAASAAPHPGDRTSRPARRRRSTDPCKGPALSELVVVVGGTAGVGDPELCVAGVLPQNLPRLVHRVRPGLVGAAGRAPRRVAPAPPGLRVGRWHPRNPRRRSRTEGKASPDCRHAVRPVRS